MKTLSINTGTLLLSTDLRAEPLVAESRNIGYFYKWHNVIFSLNNTCKGHIIIFIMLSIIQEWDFASNTEWL